METEDASTVQYFDDNTPEYGLDRLEFAVDFMRMRSGPDTSVLDVGCGTGNILEWIKEATGIEDLYGIDPAASYVSLVRDRPGMDASQGSILDSEFVRGFSRRFDFVLLASVLHHLVGTTRAESIKNARKAVENCLHLARDGGHLIVHEPMFHPSRTMDAVFCVKRFASRITSQRIQVLGKWNNIGAPVVSYYTEPQLREMLSSLGTGRLVAADIRESRLHPLLRLCGVTRRADATLVVRKQDVEGEGSEWTAPDPKAEPDGNGEARITDQ